MSHFPHHFPPPPETGYEAEQRIFADAFQTNRAEARRQNRARFLRRILFKTDP